jgi:hypothetical protein
LKWDSIARLEITKAGGQGYEVLKRLDLGEDLQTSKIFGREIDGI